MYRYDEAEQEALAEQTDDSKLPPWKRTPTRQTSRNAIYSTALYCKRTPASLLKKHYTTHF